LLASAYTATGREAEAQEAAQRVVELREQALADPAQASIDALLELAAAYLAVERNADALAHFQIAQQKAPADARPLRGLAVVYYRQGQFQQATHAFQTAIRLAPADATNHLLLGLLYTEQGEQALAQAAWQEAAKLAPCDSSPHMLLAGQHYLANELAAAAAEYGAASAIEPAKPSLLYLLGATQWQLGQLEEAAQSLERALERKNEPGVRYLLAKVYVDQADFAAAAAQYRELARLVPIEAESYTSLALDAEAVTAAQAALASHAEATTHQQLGDAYRRAGRMDLALTEYEAAYALDASDESLRQTLSYLQWDMGWQHYQACDLENAIDAANAALALDPQSTLFQAQLAGFLAAQGRTQEVDPLYARLAEAPEEDVLAHFYSGNYLVQKGETKSALRQYALALGPTATLTFTSIVYTYRAQLYVGQEDLAAAESDLNLALEVLPDNAEARLWLGDVMLLRGEAADALSLYEEALNSLAAYTAVAGVDATELLRVYVQLRRGLALQHLNRPADADQALAAALTQAQLVRKLSAGPHWPLANFALAIVYTLLGKEAEAQQAFDAATACDQSLIAARSQAEVHLATLQGKP
jgi:tetratricopeptide (TPR) repeat protein